MKTRTTLFTQIKAYYTNLTAELETAQDTISMMFLTFDDGFWAEKIAQVLRIKAKTGVRVRLMVDELGLITDNPQHALDNRALLQSLQTASVQVNIFRPGRHGLSQLNRLHCKFCAIDQRTVFLGGSNIGDYYLDWSDTNLRLDGTLGNTFHAVYDYLCQFSQGGTCTPNQQIDPSDLMAGHARVLLTIPGSRTDIRQALLQVINNADKCIYIRTWYFLPDKEILEALCRRAKAGVKVNVLLSHKTRVRPIDIANYVHAHKLALAGGHVYRYTGQYMHAKLAWNDHGEVLLGSANLDPRSMSGNFESCVHLRDQNLAWKLLQAFEDDLQKCFLQTPEIYRKRSLPGKMLSHTCNLASAWL